MDFNVIACLSNQTQAQRQYKRDGWSKLAYAILERWVMDGCLDDFDKDMFDTCCGLCDIGRSKEEFMKLMEARNERGA